jgi:hypothetical protein
MGVNHGALSLFPNEILARRLMGLCGEAFVVWLESSLKAGAKWIKAIPGANVVD